MLSLSKSNSLLAQQRGKFTSKVHALFRKIWLVETEIAFSVEEQHFIGTTAGQIHFKSACAFFGKIWHKILNISRPCGQILMKSCPAGAKTRSIVILKARGPGKFCSNGVKVCEMDQIFGKVQPGAIYLNFLGPAGGSRTRKGAFAP